MHTYYPHARTHTLHTHTEFSFHFRLWYIVQLHHNVEVQHTFAACFPVQVLSGLNPSWGYSFAEPHDSGGWRKKKITRVSLHFSDQHWMCKGSGQPGRPHSQVRVTLREDPSSSLLRLVSRKIGQDMLYLCQPFFQGLHWQNWQLVSGVHRENCEKPPTPGRSIRSCLKVFLPPGHRSKVLKNLASKSVS